MSPRILILSPSESLRLLLLQHLGFGWPEADIEDLDARELPSGQSGDNLHDYDVLVWQPDSPSTPAWLPALRDRGRTPGIVLLEQETGQLAPLHPYVDQVCPADSIDMNRLTEAVGNLLTGGYSGEVALPLSAPTDTDSDEPLLKGYEIIGSLGTGGVGAVYLAEREGDRRHLALKVLEAVEHDAIEILRQFIEEYEIAAALTSPHVVHIFDQGFTDQRAYIAMEHLAGGDLRGRIRAGLDTGTSLRHTRDMLEALAAIHAVGILHRDIKPTNIMFRDSGELVLVDFGIAAELRTVADLDEEEAQIFGTLGYMSPEQREASALDIRSDLFSVGVVLFEMLTGSRPSPLQLYPMPGQSGLDMQPPRLPDHLNTYQGLVDGLLAVVPDRRYPDARSVLRDLARITHPID